MGPGLGGKKGTGGWENGREEELRLVYKMKKKTFLNLKICVLDS